MDKHFHVDEALLASMLALKSPQYIKCIIESLFKDELEKHNSELEHIRADKIRSEYKRDAGNKCDDALDALLFRVRYINLPIDDGYANFRCYKTDRSDGNGYNITVNITNNDKDFDVVKLVNIAFDILELTNNIHKNDGEFISKSNDHVVYTTRYRYSI